MGWQHNFHKFLDVADDGNSLTQVSSTGRGEVWNFTSGVWVGDQDSPLLLTQNASSYTLIKPTGDVEIYDLTGRILTEEDQAGMSLTYTYDFGGFLRQITSNLVDSLLFDYAKTYGSYNLSSVTNSDGSIYQYEYDVNNNLNVIIFPDTTLDDNTRRIYHYENTNFPHHLTGITDENGNRYANFGYDVKGRGIFTEYAQTTNNVCQQRFDLNYQVATGVMVVDAIGTEELWGAQYILGEHKNTYRTVQTDNKGIHLNYAANGNATSYIDSEGRTTRYTYNAFNQRLSMTEAFGTTEERTTRYEYLSNDVDLITKIISPSIYADANRETTFTYDTNFNITSILIEGFDAAGNTVSRQRGFIYDSNGNVTLVDGPRTDFNDLIVSTYYDCDTGSECGRLQCIEDAAGNVVTYDDYYAAGRLLQSTNSNGVISRYTYHPRGWMLSMVQTPPEGATRTTSFEYDNIGQLTKTIFPDGTVINYSYDAAHDLRMVTDNIGNKIEYTYDAKGNRTNIQYFDPDNSLAKSIQISYDIRNNISVIDRAGSMTQLVNDAVGNVLATTDPNQVLRKQQQYDALDRLINTIDALNNTTQYGYDVADNLTRVISPNQSETTYEYDDLGNRTREVSVDRGEINYQHDPAGNIISMLDARGVEVNISYDALSRPIFFDYVGTEEDLINTYDTLAGDSDYCGFGRGRLCQQQDNGGVKKYRYDAFGNVIELTHTVYGQDYIWRYEYDKADRVIQKTYPVGREVNYTRDVIGRITDATTIVDGQLTSIMSNRQYRSDGLWFDHVLGNGIVDTRPYDQQVRLQQQLTGTTDLRVFTYDNNGNILNITDNKGTRSFTYDVLDRLQVQTLGISQWLYQYDGNGNRLQKTEPESFQEQYIYTAHTNRLSSINNSNIARDAAGNTLSDQGGARIFQYNEMGHLETVTANNNEIARYEYDKDGLRIKKITPDKTTIYLYNFEGKLLTESRITGVIEREYFYADNELLAMIVADIPDVAVIKVHADITQEASAILTSVNLGVSVATDTNGATLATIADNAGPFPLGITSVQWSTTDSSNVTISDVQRVTIVDTTAPEIAAPIDIPVQSSQAISVNLGLPVTSDIFSVTVSNDAPDLFPIGVTLVTWTATDISGNSSTATQIVTVTDPAANTAPIVIAPASITQEATALRTTVTLGVATATDNEDGVLTPVVDNPGPYPLGLTTVQWSATDSSGVTTTANQQVTITDTTPPVLIPPADITIESDVPIAIDIGAAQATDIFGVVLTAPLNHPPVLFPLGETVITWFSYDPSFNVVTATQTITVVEPSLPTADWTICAGERTICTVPVPAEVCYGANDQYTASQQVADSIFCDNIVFGDPIFGVYKYCEYRLSNTADFDGDGVVDSEDVFPADDQESADTDSDGLGDNTDPAVNDANNETGVNWTFCAYEWLSCNVPQDAWLRYGANGQYVYQRVSGSIDCNNLAFGDPIFGFYKRCEYVLINNE